MSRLIILLCRTIFLLVSGAAAAVARRHQNGIAFLHSSSRIALSSRDSSTSSWEYQSLSSTAIDEIPSDAPIEVSSGYRDPEAVLQARNRLIALSKSLTSNSPTGKFLTKPQDKKKFQQAIADLEAVASTSSPTARDRDMLLGDWMLLATASVPSSDIRRRMNEKQSSGDNKKSWFTMPKGKSGLLDTSSSSSLNPLQKSIQKSFQVTQRIRNDGGSTTTDGGAATIDRVDNVIEFTPIDSLEDILPKESPLVNIIGKVNVNPLQVKKSKVVLIHKAEVESVSPILRTKIAWTSSVVNVAGEKTSQYFDEVGSDVFGVNNILGEFLNVGTFDTPFVDNDIRVSRSTFGPLSEQLRVFVRVGSNILDNDGMLDSLTAEMRVEEKIEVSSSSIETQMKKVTDAAEKVREKVTDVLSDAMDDVVERVQDVVESDLEEIGKAVEEIQSGGDFVGAVSNATKVVSRMQGDVGSVVSEDISDVVEKLQDAVSGDDTERKEIENGNEEN